MDKYQRQLKAIELEAREAVSKARAITGKAESEGRSMTDEERGEVDALLKSLDTLKEKKGEVEEAVATRKRVEDVGKSIRVEDEESSDDKGKAEQHLRATSLGDAFVKSDGYRRLRADGVSGGKWSSGPVDIEAKAIFNSTSAGAEGNGLIQRDVQAGILPILTQRLTVADLMAQGATSSPLVRYMVESTATSGAAGVPESGLKPESTIAFDAVDESVKKIATFLPVTDEMIEDVPQLTSYINGRLALFVRQEEEDQLLNGAGGDDLDGLIGRIPGGNLDLQSAAVDAQAADHIFAAMTKVRSAFVEPDAIVIHPDDWAAIVSLKDDTGRYLAGGPFGSNPDTLWGKRVVVTAAVDAGTALVGAFASAAQIFRRGGLSVEASNSHLDYFQRNKTAIRAEERLALAVYRPAAFATADLTAAS